MTFKVIPDPNSGLRQWYSYDSLAGIHSIIKSCEDNSGLIGRISDFYTGETMKEFYGSSVEKIAEKIDEYIFSLMIKGFVTSK
jgi:hypothetical protein